MDNQSLTSPQPLPEQQTSSNLAWLKTLSIGFSLVSFGIAIGVVGYALTMNKNQPTPQNQQVESPTIQPSPTIDPSINWKEYKNEKFKYKLKYPQEAELKEFFNDIAIGIGKPIPISGACGEFSLNINYRGNDFEPTLTKDIIKKSYKTKLDGRNAYRIDKEYALEGYSCATSQILVVDKQDPKKIDFILSMNRQKLRYSDLFDQILSTFQFTDQK